MRPYSELNDKYLGKTRMRTEGIQACMKVRRRNGNAEYMEFQPGNGTRYLVVFTYLNDRNEKHNFKYYSGGSDMIVTLATSALKAMVWQQGEEAPHWTYIKGKMGLHDEDAMVLEELIDWVRENPLQE